MQLNEGVFSLNESGIQFLEKQKRTLKLSIPLTIILSLLIKNTLLELQLMKEHNSLNLLNMHQFYNVIHTYIC